jgi:hypothetical protein
MFRYLAIVSDVDRRAVEIVTDGGGKMSLAAFLQVLLLGAARRHRTSRDGHAGALHPIQSALEAVPLCSSTIVFNRFHVAQHVTEAVYLVRRREKRLLIVESLKGKIMAIKRRAGPAGRCELQGRDLLLQRGL